MKGKVCEHCKTKKVDRYIKRFCSLGCRDAYMLKGKKRSSFGDLAAQWASKQDARECRAAIRKSLKTLRNERKSK